MTRVLLETNREYDFIFFSIIYILFGYYPFTTGATTVGGNSGCVLKAMYNMQYKNIIDTLISTTIYSE